MSDCYSPPSGFVDEYYMYVYNSDNLVNGTNALNQAVQILGGYDFVLRRVVGLDSVLAAAPNGKYRIRDMAAANMSSSPLSVGGSAEFQVIPEQFYSATSQIAFDLYDVLSRNYPAVGGGGAFAAVSATFCGGSSITWTAVAPGLAGNGITVQLIAFGASPVPVVNVVGTAITVTVPSSDATGISSVTLQAIINALNADVGASALITTTGDGSPSTCFPQLGEITPTYTTAGGGGSPLIPYGQIGFGGVRRRRGSVPKPTYKYKLLPYQVQITIAVTWEAYTAFTGTAITAVAPPRSFYVPIENYDFELYSIQITDTAGYGASSAKLSIYNGARNTLSNLPVVASYLTDAVPWGRASADRYNIGAIVPPLLYLNETNIQIDVYSLLPTGNVPQTLTILFNGMQRIPC